MVYDNIRDYLLARTALTVKLFLPFALLAASTLRPFGVDILSRNPCLFLFFLSDGWNVLLLIAYYFKVKTLSYFSDCKDIKLFICCKLISVFAFSFYKIKSRKCCASSANRKTKLIFVAHSDLYFMFTPAELSKIKNLLTPEKKIVILTHYNPDGDAIGSSLGLKHFLAAKGIEAEVIVPNDFPKFLKWMPGAKQIIIADYKRKKAGEAIYHADLIFVLDFNSAQRSGNLVGPWLQKARATKILIDHHQQPDPFDYVYSDVSIPATCQMVYHFIQALEEEELVNKDIAECLYTGIMTDTGGFRFRSTSATTHRIVANLIEKGADPAKITSNTWDTNTVSRLHLLALVLGRIEVVQEGKVAILWLKRDELKELGFQKGDTEGFVNYGLGILGTQMSAFFMEDLYEDFIKISFRSKEDLDVNQFSRKYFNGGGHINAAGGKYYKSLENTIEDFKDYVEQEDI